MIPKIKLTEAMTDPALFGATFNASSFWTRRAVAKLIDGIALTEERELELFKQATGRTELPQQPVHCLHMLSGRRAGKDRFFSAAAVWRAALCADWRQYISVGEQAVVLLLGKDKKQAGVLRRYCVGLIDGCCWQPKSCA